jgi:hypothetical protein
MLNIYKEDSCDEYGKFVSIPNQTIYYIKNYLSDKL